MNFREYLMQLDPKLLIEGTEEMDAGALLLEIRNLLEGMTEDEVDEFGAFLSIEFFESSEDDLEDVYFDVDNVLDMVEELGEESYSFILDLLLPEDFTASDELDFDNYDDYEEVDGDISEGVSRVMKAKRRNMKKRKFFKKSAATLRKERAARMKANRMNRASRKAYTRVNKAKLASYQKSRAGFMRKGKHFAKIRRQAGE